MNNRGFLTIPMAIVVAAVLISGAIIYATGRNSIQQANLEKIVERTVPPSAPPAVENIKPVTVQDHLFGKLNAPVKVVEFSDTECPFCKRFHDTMHQIVNNSGGKVVWVYRHFPLDSLHSKARKEAAATECANELGGNEKFWAYLDRLFEITPSNDGLDLAQLPKIAEHIGLNRAKFESCLNSGKYDQRIESDYQDAIAAGGSGTPYSVVIAPNNTKSVISGAQPYQAVKQAVDAALSQK